MAAGRAACPCPRARPARPRAPGAPAPRPGCPGPAPRVPGMPRLAGGWPCACARGPRLFLYWMAHRPCKSTVDGTSTMLGTVVSAPGTVVSGPAGRAAARDKGAARHLLSSLLANRLPHSHTGIQGSHPGRTPGPQREVMTSRAQARCQRPVSAYGF